MRKLLFSAAIALSATLLTQAANAQVSGTGLKKITSKPFSTGLQTGFWEQNKQQLTLDSIGKRPTSRVGFYKWNSFETSPGQYDFSGACGAYQKAHNYGETVYGAINICFSDSVMTDGNAIPAWYVHDIANPATQAAALKFLKNYVAYVLTHVGNITLTIDYEIMSNYKLNQTATDGWGKTTKKRAKNWHDWYINAVRAARDTAAAMGKSNLLKLMPIVNSNPFDTDNPIHTGPSDTSNRWLLDVVDSSDYLAFDTYQSDSTTPVSSPQTTFKIMQFWIDSFSRNKDVIVTENGYNVSPSYLPGVTRPSRKYKTTGTIQQADTFYRQLFDSLIIKAQPSGSFHGKMRSYNIWSICDNTAKDNTDPDYYFGIIGIDTTTHLPYARPALNTVRNGYARIDTSATLRPYDDSVVVNTATPDTLTYSNGDSFDYLRYRAKFNSSSLSYYLHITTSVSGNLMVHINNSKWLYFPYTTHTDVNLSTSGALLYFNNSQNNVIEVYCTDSLFPFRQIVTDISVNNLPTRQAQGPGITGNTAGISVYPNPTHSMVTIAGVDMTIPFRAEIFNTMGQLVKTANTTEINVTDLANGVYHISITQEGKTTTVQFVKE